MNPLRYTGACPMYLLLPKPTTLNSVVQAVRKVNWCVLGDVTPLRKRFVIPDNHAKPLVFRCNFGTMAMDTKEIHTKSKAEVFALQLCIELIDAKLFAKCLPSYIDYINATTIGGNTPLLVLFQKFPPEADKRDSFYNIAEMLLRNRADPNVTNRQGDTVLHQLVQYEPQDDEEAKLQQSLLRLLIHYKADMKIKNHEDKIPAQLVATQELGEILASHDVRRVIWNM